MNRQYAPQHNGEFVIGPVDCASISHELLWRVRVFRQFPGPGGRGPQSVRDVSTLVWKPHRRVAPGRFGQDWVGVRLPGDSGALLPQRMDCIDGKLCGMSWYSVLGGG